MEPLAGRLPQFRGKLQVIVGTDNADMAHKSGQMRQFGLDIQSLSVPALEDVESKTMPRVMKPGRMSLGIDDVGAEA